MESDNFSKIEFSLKENTKITRMQKFRIISHIILYTLIALHMITWYIMEIQIVGNIGIESFFYGLAYGIINAGLIYWVLALMSALLFRRAFCGWFCMFGGYQEVVDWGFKKSKIRIPRRPVLYLGSIAFTGLIVMIFTFSYGSYVRDTSRNDNITRSEYFENITESRIILTKIDNTAFTENEINQKYY